MQLGVEHRERERERERGREDAAVQQSAVEPLQSGHFVKQLPHYNSHANLLRSLGLNSHIVARGV